VNTRNRLIAGGVFVVILIALILVVRFVDFSGGEGEPTPVGPEPPGPLFADAQLEQVTSFTVVDNTSGDRLAVHALEPEAAPTPTPEVEDLFAVPDSGLHWQIDEAPVDSTTGIVDDVQINSAVFSLPAIVPNRWLEDVNPADYGIADDKGYTLTFGTTGGFDYTLYVGDQAATSPAYYVAVEGLPGVYLVPSYALDPVLGFLTEPPYMDALIEELGPTPTDGS